MAKKVFLILIMTVITNFSPRHSFSFSTRGSSVGYNYSFIHHLLVWQGLAKDRVKEMRELILERYDKNFDGRLEINEVSHSNLPQVDLERERARESQGRSLELSNLTESHLTETVLRRSVGK